MTDQDNVINTLSGSPSRTIFLECVDVLECVDAIALDDIELI